jgi:hypothetical protein
VFQFVGWELRTAVSETAVSLEVISLNFAQPIFMHTEKTMSSALSQKSQIIAFKPIF